MQVDDLCTDRKCCFQGGMYLLQLMDHHVCSGTTLLLLSFCQSVSIGWVYGESQTGQPTVTDTRCLHNKMAVMSAHLDICTSGALTNWSQRWPLTFLMLCFPLPKRCWPFLRQHHRNDWLSSVPIHEILLALRYTPVHFREFVIDSCFPCVLWCMILYKTCHVQGSSGLGRVCVGGGVCGATRTTPVIIIMVIGLGHSSRYTNTDDRFNVFVQLCSTCFYRSTFWLLNSSCNPSCKTPGYILYRPHPELNMNPVCVCLSLFTGNLHLLYCQILPTEVQ